MSEFAPPVYEAILEADRLRASFVPVMATRLPRSITT